MKSPTKQRGRDFAIMLKSLNDLGYCVEWRVINAAEYGMPQRRKRVFIIAYHNSTNIFKQIEKDHTNYILTNSTIEKAFNSTLKGGIEKFNLPKSIMDIQNGFKNKKSPFLNSGLMINSTVYTFDVKEKYNGERKLLKDVLVDNPNKDFYIDEKDKPRWEYLKGSKSFDRVSKDGHKYKYSEGKMTYPDDINKPSRTIITGEGGKAPSRFKHIIEDENGLRRLTPIELERLNMFPDNHTKLEGISDTKRAFFMGNALVVGVVEKLAKALEENINFFNN